MISLLTLLATTAVFQVGCVNILPSSNDGETYSNNNNVYVMIPATGIINNNGELNFYYTVQLGISSNIATSLDTGPDTLQQYTYYVSFDNQKRFDNLEGAKTQLLELSTAVGNVDYLRYLYEVGIDFTSSKCEQDFNASTLLISTSFTIDIDLWFKYFDNTTNSVKDVVIQLNDFLDFDYTINLNNSTNTVFKDSIQNYVFGVSGFSAQQDIRYSTYKTKQVLFFNIDNTIKNWVGDGSMYQQGYTDGYNKGTSESLNNINPLMLAFNGISKVLNLEIFPNFKIAYIVAFSLLVMLVRFALSFFH